MSAQFDPAALMARLNASLSAIQASSAELEAAELRSSARNAEANAAREKAARSGEFGPEWARLQQKIDLGQTTLEAVFTGTDESREAEAVRRMSQQRLAETSDSLEVGEDEEPTELQAAVAELFALRARVAARAAERADGSER
jgi:hypothetical protein